MKNLSKAQIKQAVQQLSNFAKQLQANPQTTRPQHLQPPPAPSQQALNNAVAQGQSPAGPSSANLPAPPKPFHTRLGKSRNIKTISAAQAASSPSTAKYKAFLNRALSNISPSAEDGVDTNLLREKLGLPAEAEEQSKNLYLMEDLSEAERFELFRNMKSRLSVYFDSFKPARWESQKSYYVREGIWHHTCSAYQYVPEPTFDIDVNKITERQVIDACLLISEYNRLRSSTKETKDSNAADILSKVDSDRYGESEAHENHALNVLKKVGSSILKELYNNSGDIEKVEIMEAIEHYKEQGKIVSVFEESDKLYADVFKLSDKYSIRLGDGERFVASDNVKITFRDPSENPSWAIWFLDAVPLSKIPDRTSMLFLPKDQWIKHYPEPLENYPIVCHASLWQLPENQTGVLLHTAWHSLAVAYRWHIDKPLDVARIMFKAVSHPAHVARNFGFAPQIREPGEAWF